MRSRIVAVVACAAAPAMLLAGCGGSNASGASATLERIQPTSFVTLVPATTTTTTTVPETETGAEGPTTADGEQSYTVVAGDSVYRIAEIHGVDPEVLAQYNEWPEGVQHFLSVGDTVRIPPGSQVPGSGTATDDTGDTGETDDAADDAATDTGCTYTIVEGDNPSKVADKFEITVQDLVANNPESVMNSFLIGATLVIPAGANCDQ